MDISIKKNFIKKVGQSGLSFMEIACISGIPEITLFKFAGGDIEFNNGEQKLLATILDCAPEEVFPGHEGQE